MMTIAGALLALAAIFLASLCVPVELSVSAATRRGVRLRGRWLFGLVRFEAASRSSTRARPEEHPWRPQRPGRGLRTARRLLAIDGLGTRLATLAGRLIATLRWRGFVAVRAGLEDPADTGELCGWLGWVNAWNPAPAWRVAFEPDFGGETFEAEAEASVRVVPARVLVALSGFAVSRPGRRAIAVMVWNR